MNKGDEILLKILKPELEHSTSPRDSQPSKTEHTYGPWDLATHAHSNFIKIMAGLQPIAELNGPDAPANARRIVACVNACDGFADSGIAEVLKQGGFDKIFDQAKQCALERNRLAALNGELVEALKSAELFLRTGASYAPDETIDRKIGEERMAFIGLRTTMIKCADAARALLEKVKS